MRNPGSMPAAGKRRRCALILLILSVFLFVPELVIFKGEAKEKDEFFLHLVLQRDEVSKDSSTEISDVRISGRDVVFKRSAWGFGREEGDRTMSFQVTARQKDRILSFIREKGLDRDLREEKPHGDIGISVSMSLEIRLDGKTTRAAVSGMYRKWVIGSPGKSNLANLEYCRSAEALAALVKSFAKR